MVKASSLYESIIATVLIAIAIAIVSLVFGNVVKSSGANYSYFQLLNKRDSLIVSAKNLRIYKDATFSYRGYRVTSFFLQKEKYIVQTIRIYKGDKITSINNIVHKKKNEK